MREVEEFRLVTRRKKRNSRFRGSLSAHNSNSMHVDFANKRDSNSEEDRCAYDDRAEVEALSRKLCDAEVELKQCAFMERFLEALAESLNALSVNGITEILCYGLGCFSERKASKYQLASLLLLRQRYGCEVYIYDPAFSAKEIIFLKKYGFRIIKNNEEGKRAVSDNTTLVYMPHCSLHLINNFLYANWGENLSNCILVTNSLSDLAENSTAAGSSSYVDYVYRVRPYVTEIALRNDFIYEEAFNDLGVHIFPKQELAKAPSIFWTSRKEPCYRDLRVEFITAEEDTIRMNPNVKLVRALVREIRRSSYEEKAKDNALVRYIFEQARAHRETSEVLCKARQELQNLAETYLCYLTSRRTCKEIQKRYAGKGERSIKETADLVGFKLPHDPK